MQIDFDLLGELIKFNKSLFRDLNGYLAGEKFNVFVEVCSFCRECYDSYAIMTFMRFWHKWAVFKLCRVYVCSH